MSELRLPLIDKLAEKLVTPDRYGDLALRGFTTELDREYPDLPETRRVFHPLPPDTEHTLERLDRLGRLG